MSNKLLSLCIVREGDKVLLGMKKRGFGAGFWNGFGGKVEPGETIEQGARRELQEEAGIVAASLTQVGRIDFDFVDDPVRLEVHVFLVDGFTGIPMETEEMRPQWYDLAAIPYEKMWLDDRYWLPLALEGKLFKGRFLFRGTDKIVEYALETDPQAAVLAS